MKQYGRAALVLLAIPLSATAQPGAVPAGGDVAVVYHHRHIYGPTAIGVTVFPPVRGGLVGGSPFAPLYGGAILPWVGYPPPLFWGIYPPFGYAGLGPAVMPPVVIDGQPPGPDAVPPAVPSLPRGRGAAMPGAVASRFRPVGKADRDRARQPVRPERAPPPAVIPPDPKSEHAALVLDGRRAFAGGEYGRAAELFRRATDVQPEPADAEFLLAQSQFALGKYPEAVASVYRGLVRQPDWPAVGPALRDLYDGHAERLSEHRRLLDEAAAAGPGDPALAFLRAYVRWFDGERDSAREFFRALRDRVARPGVIDRFLVS
jgi:hypothetical protein